VSARPRLVVDTNVVLDLLVFGDPGTHRLRKWLDAGVVAWLGSDTMRAELAHVLARGFGERWQAVPSTVVSEWDRQVAVQPEAAACGLNCSDPDDQKFIDLAVAHAPCRLLSRDRALLRLAPRAAQRGVLIHRPGDLPLSPD
jgi:predicted nucleic acid-binding protein